MTHDNKTTSSLGPEASAELDRFQKGLEFINVVRGDIDEFQRQETKACVADTIDAHETGKGNPVLGTPSLIGRFDVRSAIGEGGFATVYLAFDPVLNREVALKVLRVDHNSSPESTARFEKEARVAALLSHPNIVPVFDAGISDGQPYIVSRYCHGVPLSTWMDQHKSSIDIRLAAKIVQTIADAVEYAHERGVIHRDLKPSNVLVEIDEPESCESAEIPNRLRVTDFGLAKCSEDVDQMKTIDGAILGTPAFMSPEQAEGKTVTKATDVYSIGVMLYQLMTGHLPHLGETHLQTIFAITNDESSAPSRWNRQIPRDLDAICLKCLNKNPDMRYSSAYELADDIGNWLSGQPVSASLISVPERVVKWCKRNPWLSTAFAVTSVALLFAVIQLYNANSNFHRAQQENTKSKRNIQLAQDTIKEMVNKIAPSSSIPIELRKELVVRAVELQERLLADDPGNRRIIYETADSYSALSVLHEQLRQFDEALKAADNAIDLVLRTPPRPDNQVEQQTDHRARLQKSEILVMLNRNEEALEVLSLTNIKRDNAHQLAQRIKGEARILENQNKHKEAWLKANEAKLIYEAIPPDIFSKGGYADVLYQIGIIEIASSQFDYAEQSLLKAIDVYNDVGSQIPYHETLACSAGMAHWNLAWARKQLGKSTAIESITESAGIFDVLLDHNDVRPVYLEYACQVYGFKSDLLIDDGLIEEAVDALDQAQSIFEKIPLPKHGEGIATDKTESDNLRAKDIAIELIERRLIVAEKSSDKNICGTQLQQIETMLLFLNTHFSDFADSIEELESRLIELK